jgi:hypothetical protein
LKLAPLLVQYLYTHKRLDLAGIGSFFLNEPISSDSEKHKHDKPANPENISFESNPGIRQNPELVQFISEHSGKIKALASADLESHLTLAKQFLNIGNPFFFEGIGTLEKIRSGEYALAPGTRMQEKTKEFAMREKQGAPAEKEFKNDYKNIFYSGKVKMNWRKPFAGFLIITGLILAVWGGYTVYKKTIAKNKSAAGDNNKKVVTPAVNDNKDTVMFQKDRVVIPVQQATTGMQKFILEICNAQRAFERFSRLKTFQWNVQLETNDSVTYKLFMVLPASAGDTSHIIDSLSRLNGRRVYIEQ